MFGAITQRGGRAKNSRAQKKYRKRKEKTLSIHVVSDRRKSEGQEQWDKGLKDSALVCRSREEEEM